MSSHRRPRFLDRGLVLLCALVLPSAAALATPSRYEPPQLSFIQGLTRVDRVDSTSLLRVVVELNPKDPGLDTAAAAAIDPASPSHRAPLTEAQFAQRYGRSQSEVDALASLLRANGARDVYVSSNRLVVGGTLTTVAAEAAFKTKFAVYEAGSRSAIAPVTPLTLPVDGVRAVRGVVAAVGARLADVPTMPAYTTFRGAWYPASRFREAYDAVSEGGRGAKIALIEDASDRFDRKDLQPFLDAGGAPAGASESNVTERVFVEKSPTSECGRDDRGQEATIDLDAAITLAPLAQIELRYEDICARGDEGTIALQRTLDDPQPPNVIVLPIVAGPVYGPAAQSYGPTAIPYLEAALRGIPIVVPSGDDGAYGYHIPGLDRPAVAYPCVLPYVICAGGTQLGDHTGESSQGASRGPRQPSNAPRGAQIVPIDEGPWNDGFNASGGGISADPRPPWQVAPEAFEFSPQFVKFRVVPDVSADASGHLLAYWHGYNFGGVAGTSESAALVAAQIAAIDAAVAPEHRITSAGDLYALVRAHPEAFRPVTHENDRGYIDNTLRPRPLPLPLDYRGPLPSPPPVVNGCAGIQPRGCTVAAGYNAVTGIGSLRESAAINALR